MRHFSSCCSNIPLTQTTQGKQDLWVTHSSGVLSIMVVKSRRQEREAVSHIFSGTREGGTLMITYVCPFYIVPDTGNWASLL